MTCEDEPRLQPTSNDSEPVLLEPTPTASAPADIKIAHVQLRDLLVCPGDRGVVWYVGNNCIVEHDILDPVARPHVLVRLTFTPVTLTTLSLCGNRVLLAAGGQERELFLALYYHIPPLRFSSRSSTARSEAPSLLTTALDEEELNTNHDQQEAEKRSRELQELRRRRDCHGRYSREIWQHSTQFDYPASINNSVMLCLPPIVHESKDHWPSSSTSGSDTRTKETLPRLAVSNNDCTVKIFNVSLTKGGFGTHMRETWYGFGRGNRVEDKQLECIGVLKLPVPVNHTSVSPDGSTLLSCGDSSSIYLHRIISKSPFSSTLDTSSNFLDFELLITLSLPPSPSYPSPMVNPYLPYAFVDGAWTLAGAPVSSCFATAWNKDGSKFGVASQEGMVLVWDVRSGEPLKGGRWETMRDSNLDEKNVGLNGTWVRDASGELRREGTVGVDDPASWYASSGDAPAWGVRVLKFAKNDSGREILVFTEHASKVHVIDADTFSTHDVIRVPHVAPRKPTPPSPSPPVLHIEEASLPSGTRSQEYFTQSYERRRDFLSAFNTSGHDLSHRPEPARGHLGGFLSPRGYMAGGTRPMAIGGPRHASAPTRILSPNLPLARSPESMSFDQSPRSRSATMPSNSPRSQRTSIGWSDTTEPDLPLRGGRRRDVVHPARPSGLAGREATFDINHSPPSNREVRERRAAEMRDMGVNAEDALMEEDIAWHMVLDALERDDVEIASEQNQDGRQDQTERLRDVLLGRYSSTTHRSRSSAQSRTSPTEMERVESRLLNYLETAGLQIERNGSSAVGHLRSAERTANSTEVNEGRPSLLDWDYECTTPPSPLFSADLARAASASGATGSATTADSDMTDSVPTLPELSEEIISLPGLFTRMRNSRESTDRPELLSPPALPPFRELIESTNGRRLDIAGVCFDKTGTYMYVATVDGITEWKVRGSELRWWGGGGLI